MNVLYASLLLVGFFGLCWLMWWDIRRKCEAAQREVDLDALLGDDEDWEVAA